MKKSDKKNSGGKSDNRRVQKVEHEVQRVVASYIVQHLQGELPGMITVSRVKMPADLRTAKVYVSVLSPDGTSQATDNKIALETLKDHSAEIQRVLADKMAMRFCPRLSFYRDDSTEQVMKVDQLLRHLQQEREQRSGGESPSEASEDSDVEDFSNERS